MATMTPEIAAFLQFVKNWRGNHPEATGEVVDKIDAVLDSQKQADNEQAAAQYLTARGWICMPPA